LTDPASNKKTRVVSRWAFACVNSKLARDITWCQWFLMANLSACHPKKKALHDLGLFIHGFSQFGSKNQPNKTMDWWFVALLYTVKPVLHTPHIQAGTVAAVVTRRTVFTCLGLSCWCCSLRFPPCCALSPLAIPQYHRVAVSRSDECLPQDECFGKKEQSICFRIFLPMESAILRISAS